MYYVNIFIAYREHFERRKGKSVYSFSNKRERGNSELKFRNVFALYDTPYKSWSWSKKVHMLNILEMILSRVIG